MMMLLLLLLLLVVVLLLLLFVILFVRSVRYKPAPIPPLHILRPFPTTRTSPLPTLSIIIPAYNEQERLGTMLQETYHYLSNHQNSIVTQLGGTGVGGSTSANNKDNNHQGGVEFLLVSDGSTDRTLNVYQEFVRLVSSSSSSNNNMSFSYLHLSPNQGKGAACRAGMLTASGTWRLLVDADGATNMATSLPHLIQYCSTYPIIWGSRAHLTMSSSSSSNNHKHNNHKHNNHRTLFRTILMKGFHAAVAWICRNGGSSISTTNNTNNTIQDTQCGFKLFSAATAVALFQNLHIARWAFDVELLLVANYLNLAIKEVPVEWMEVEGSKLHTSIGNVVLVSLAMLRDMMWVRMCYGWGIWKLPTLKQE